MNEFDHSREHGPRCQCQRPKDTSEAGLRRLAAAEAKREARRLRNKRIAISEMTRSSNATNEMFTVRFSYRWPADQPNTSAPPQSEDSNAEMISVSRISHVMDVVERSMKNQLR